MPKIFPHADPQAKSFADLLEDESTGWPVDRELARLRELAAADRPTLKQRFTDQYVINDPKSKLLMRFFANKARTMSNHRMVVAQGLLQAACARALDHHMAEMVLANLRRLHPGLPQTVDAVMSRWPNMHRTLRHYLVNVPKIPTFAAMTSGGGFPGVGASEDGTGQIRLHMPMEWLSGPLEMTLTFPGFDGPSSSKETRQPFTALAGVLKTFIQSFAYGAPFAATPEVRQAVGDAFFNGNARFPHHDVHTVAVAYGFTGGNRMPHRDLVRIGGPSLRKEPGDLDAAMEFYEENRLRVSNKDGYVPKGGWIAKNMFAKPQHKQIVGAVYDLFDSAEMMLSLMPSELIDRVKPDATFTDRNIRWGAEVRIAACVPIPRELAAYISQSDEPILRSVSMWAGDGYEWGFGASPNAPGPHPNTVEQVGKMEGVIKDAKVTNDDDLAFDHNGWPRYLPDTSLDEFEVSDRKASDLYEIKLGGADMYDPQLARKLSIVPEGHVTQQMEFESNEDVDEGQLTEATNRLNAGLDLENFDPIPKDPPRDSVLYTNWQLGAATWTDARGEVQVTGVGRWQPLKPSHLVRFMSRRGLTSVLYAQTSYGAALQHMCEQAGLSTMISDYVRPEDLAIFVPADKRGDQLGQTGEGLKIVPVGGAEPGTGPSLDALYRAERQGLGVRREQGARPPSPAAHGAAVQPGHRRAVGGGR